MPVDACLTAVCCALFAFTLWQGSRPGAFAMPGARPWAAAMACWALAAACAALLASPLARWGEPVEAPWWSWQQQLWLGAWAALSAGAVCLYRGICAFRRVRPQRRWVALPLAAAWSGTVGLHALWPRSGAVAVVACLAATWVLSTTLLLFARRRERPDPAVPAHWVLDLHPSQALALTVLLGWLVWAVAQWVELLMATALVPGDGLSAPAVLGGVVAGADSGLLPVSALALGCGLWLMLDERVRQQWRQQVSHDALTGGYTHRAFIALAEAELGRALRSQRDATLMALEVDRFERLLERHGPVASEELLRKLADVTRACLRREDIFGRAGAQAWWVLLPDTPVDAAAVVAERIRASVEATRVKPHGRDEALRCTVSIGLASTQRARELDELIRCADQACRIAQQRGRNRVERAA